MYAAALGAGLLVLVGVSAAQDDPAPPQCSWETAERLTVRGIDAAETTLRGRCVRVRAKLDGWALRAPRPHRGLEVTQIDFIGAYSHVEGAFDPFHDRPRRVEVLGVVGHCSDVCAAEWDAVRREREAAEAEGRAPSYEAICMPAGFCHYYDDPYVLIQDIR